MSACDAIPMFFRILGAGQECVDLALKYSIAVEKFGQEAFDEARKKCKCQK